MVRYIFPSMNREIRETVIPSIDSTLVSMLGYGSEDGITKESIDVEQIFDNDGISGIRYIMVYKVDDFVAPEAPRDAIEEDCNSIKDSVSSEKIEISDISIDTDNGTVRMVFEIDLRKYMDDKDRIPQ